MEFTSKLTLTGLLPIRLTPCFCLLPSHVQDVEQEPPGVSRPAKMTRVYYRPGFWDSRQALERTIISDKKETGKFLWPLLKHRAPSDSVTLHYWPIKWAWGSGELLFIIKYKPSEPSLLPHHHSESWTGSLTPLLFLCLSDTAPSPNCTWCKSGWIPYLRTASVCIGVLRRPPCHSRK